MALLAPIDLSLESLADATAAFHFAGLVCSADSLFERD